MSRLLYRIGFFAGRHPWRVLGPWLVIAVAAMALNASVGGHTNDTFRLPGAQSQRAADELKARFPQQSVFTSQVVIHSEHSLTTADAKHAVAETTTALAKVPHVVDVASPYDPRGPAVSPDGRTAFVTVAFDTDKILRREYDAAAAATHNLRDAGLQVEYSGLLGLAKGDSAPGSEVIGIAIAVLVLVVAFGSIVA